MNVLQWLTIFIHICDLTFIKLSSMGILLRASYQINTLFWLDDFGVWVQSSYSKVYYRETLVTYKSQPLDTCHLTLSKIRHIVFCISDYEASPQIKINGAIHLWSLSHTLYCFVSLSFRGRILTVLIIVIYLITTTVGVQKFQRLILHIFLWY
jgi:hypothetical protein